MTFGYTRNQLEKANDTLINSNRTKVKMYYELEQLILGGEVLFIRRCR